MGTLNAEKLKKINEFIELTRESLTHSEFLEAFKQVTDYIKKAEQNLGEKIDEKTQKANDEFEKLQETYQETIKKIESENESTLSNVKKWAMESVGKLFAKSKINEKIKKMDEMMAEMESHEMPDEDKMAEKACDMACEKMKPMMPEMIKLDEELPKMGEKIRDSLELLPEGEKLKIEAIEKLREELDELKNLISQKSTQSFGGGGVGKQNVYYKDLSDSLDGVTKTFSMPAFARILKIELSSAPVLRPTTDWTADASLSQITFTSEIDADPLLNAGQSLIVYYAI